MRHPATSGTDEPLLAWPGIDNLRDTLPLSAHVRADFLRLLWRG